MPLVIHVICMYAGCAAHFRCYVDSVVLSRVQEASQCIVDFFRGRVARLNLARIIPGTPEWHTALRYFTALSDQPAWGLAASAMIQSYESLYSDDHGGGDHSETDSDSE